MHGQNHIKLALLTVSENVKNASALYCPSIRILLVTFSKTCYWLFYARFKELPFHVCKWNPHAHTSMVMLEAEISLYSD